MSDKFTSYYKTDRERDAAKRLMEYVFSPQLEVIVNYPNIYRDQQEEFFDENGDLSGVLLVKKSQRVCYQEPVPINGKIYKIDDVSLGELMLPGVSEKRQFSPMWLKHKSDEYINLNHYITSNGLQKPDDRQSDPRNSAKDIVWLDTGATKQGVDNVLRVGAPREP